MNKLITAVTILALVGIAAVVASSLVLVQSVGASNVMTSTTAGEGEEEQAISTTNTTTTNNNSNAVLGSMFFIGEREPISFNPINETYIEVSFVGNATIMPPNATNTTINATETGNVTINIQPNSLSFGQGQSLIVNEGDDDGGAEQENAITTFVDISRTNPDGTESGTQVVFFSTNSTGQLAFLDNMVAIAQFETSPERGIIRIWEWKGGMLTFGSGSPAPITGNQTTITSVLEEEEG